MLIHQLLGIRVTAKEEECLIRSPLLLRHCRHLDLEEFSKADIYNRGPVLGGYLLLYLSPRALQRAVALTLSVS